jgi:hypothetical protein
MASNNHNYKFDLDVALEKRIEVKARQLEEEKRRREQERREEYNALKTEHEIIEEVDIPEATQQQQKTDNLLMEDPPAPPEGHVIMLMGKGVVYGLLAALLTFSGTLLVFSVVEVVLFSLPAFVRWIVSGAIVTATVVAFHWAVRHLSRRLRTILVVVMLLLAVINLVTLAYIDSKYNSLSRQQASGEMTADQAQQEAETLDAFRAFARVTLGLILEGLGALAVSRSSEILTQQYHYWRLYRRRRYWEQVFAQLLKRKITLENKMQLYDDLKKHEQQPG